jgi:GNAT superfamily N-acetyltransferase
MDSPASESLAVDVFEMRLADIDAVDLAQLHALSIAVGWPHRAEDWQLMRGIGRGIVALDEIDRVLGSAMWFPYTESLAAVGMVITSPRLQALGTGQWLMKRIMAECEGRAFRLNATRAALRLYLSLDFNRQKTVFQCQGEANWPESWSESWPRPSETAELRPLVEADLAGIIARDAEAYGVPRTKLITGLLQQSSGHGLFRSDQLEAFALCRRFGRGHVVGPVVASCDEDAIAVVAPHVVAHERHFLRLDTHLEAGPFRTFIEHAGLSVYDTVTTLSLHAGFTDPNRRNASQPVTYALASQAFG